MHFTNISSLNLQNNPGEIGFILILVLGNDVPSLCCLKFSYQHKTVNCIFAVLAISDTNFSLRRSNHKALFSFGCIFYRMTAGPCCFHGNDFSFCALLFYFVIVTGLYMENELIQNSFLAKCFEKSLPHLLDIN